MNDSPNGLNFNKQTSDWLLDFILSINEQSLQNSNENLNLSMVYFKILLA